MSPSPNPRIIDHYLAKWAIRCRSRLLTAKNVLRLISINDFRKRYFVSGRAPTAATIRRWIECGDIRGRKIGKLYSVDIDAWKHATGLDPLADRILDELSR